ncbi:MAG: Unknown, probable insecticidal toxin [uncultured Paraburkholderia sp.]|nr:MAG: Unknown, probable insecticidal toxin [uncultured Paraburkholderia sp.]
MNLDDALVLSGAAINTLAADGQVSHFDRIFNSPPLGGTRFNPQDGPLALQLGEGEDSVATATLKRGLGVNGGDLRTLCHLLNGTITDTITGDINTISHLWRLRLLAREHELSVQELNPLYQLSPCHGLNAASLSLFQWRALTEFLYQARLLMTDMALSVGELYLLCTHQSATSLTPEMNNLLLSVRQSVASVEMDQQNHDSLAGLLSPFIAAALSLSSSEMGRYVLLWTQVLQPDELSITEFAELAVLDSLHPEQSARVARFCHAMAQTGITVQKLMLSEAEVASLVHSGNQLMGDGLPTDRVNMLKSLHAFHRWLNGLGVRSSDVLAALEQGTLTPEMLASVMETELLMIEQAMTCAEVVRLDNWQNIYRVLQWKNVSDALNVMPVTTKQLLSLQYVSLPNRSDDDGWQDWQNLAHAMEAALHGRQSQALEAYTAERFSAVLSAWFRTYCQPKDIYLRNRDELYSYLLIDNQVSAQVRTTRLAEAIASLQLYINRALNRMEGDRRHEVITRQFFLDWSLNSRYSSWSGVSMLAYYPENYIDPTLLIGQTRMMDELLENISQGKLSQDAVEDAFRTYLTRFETVADLKVISAYHDNVNSDSGITWLLGRNKENLQEYHWRAVDISKLHNGSLPANAWGEWTSIDMLLNAWQDMVRPVVFRGRLYIIWVEWEERAATESNGHVSTQNRFTLKLAFRRHDGTWSAPWNHDVTAQFESIPAGTKPLALSVSGFAGDDTLLVFIYRVDSSYAEFGPNNKSVTGLAIAGDGSFTELESAYLSRYSTISNTFDAVPISNGNLIKRSGYRFSQSIETPGSLELHSIPSDGIVSLIDNASIQKIKIDYSASRLEISLVNPTLTFRFNSRGVLGNQQLIAMNNCGSPGDQFIISETSTNFNLISVYNKRTNRIGLVSPGSRNKSRIDFNITSNWRGTPVITTGWNNGVNTTSTIEVGANRQQDFRSCHFTHFVSEYTINHGGNPWEPNPDGIWGTEIVTNLIHSSQNSKFLDIETSIDNKSPFIIASSGGWTQSFYASDADALSIIPAQTFGDMYFQFNTLKLDASELTYIDNKSSIEISYVVQDENGRQIALARNTLNIEKVAFSPDNILQFHSTGTGAQYMQLGVHRIRLNTLLAPQLVWRAAVGIDALLTMETQKLLEPQLGKGFYVTLTLPPYDASVHGTNRNFKLNLKHVVNNDYHVIHSGQFQDTELSVRLFVPLDDIPLNDGYVAKVFLTTQRDPDDGTYNGPHFTSDVNGKIGINSNSIISMFRRIVIHNGINAEPIDFDGACALYFWELFYYTPMMAFQRLFQEQNFSDATRWLNYVWNPVGYIVQGQLQNYQWNVRPLEEETSWNANPLDSVDPDAVAQADPMHYKVVTFMRMLDLLIARGDIAYRQLERDTLNEAKMWYV